CVLEIAPLFALALIACGEDATASMLVTHLQAIAQAQEMPSLLAEAQGLDGLLRAQVGDWATAEAAFDEALACMEALPNPYMAAKLAYAAGRAYLHDDQREHAQALFTAALTQCVALGEMWYRPHLERHLEALCTPANSHTTNGHP